MAPTDSRPISPLANIIPTSPPEPAAIEIVGMGVRGEDAGIVALKPLAVTQGGHTNGIAVPIGESRRGAPRHQRPSYDRKGRPDHITGEQDQT
jgi:hypothetical protein